MASLSRLEQLPPEVWGHILDHLNQLTQTDGVYNDADMVVALKNAANLSRVSKTLYRKINSPFASQMFIDSVTRKYRESLLFFVRLNGGIVNHWLWHVIDANCDREKYPIIQKMYPDSPEHMKRKALDLDFSTIPPTKKTPREDWVLEKIWSLLETESQKNSPAHRQTISQSRKKEVLPPVLNHISDVASWGVDLVQQLMQQPAFEGTGSLSASKVLVLKNGTAAQILEHLHCAAQGTTYGYIHAFGLGQDIRTLQGKNLGYGLELVPYDRSFDLNFLKTQYETVLTHVLSHWEQTTLKNHPLILHRQSEEEYTLFVQDPIPVHDGCRLLWGVAYLLGIEKLIHCHNVWTTLYGYDFGPNYLWIKTNRLAEVLRALRLSTTLNQNSAESD